MAKLADGQLVILTGGAGFIGSHVVRHLNDQGINNIVIFDELKSSDKWRNLVGKKFIDILPKSACFEWLKGKEKLIESFIHLGACSSTVERDASYLLENNYRFSVNLAEYALQHGHRFIYASSAATYGNGEVGFSDNEDQLNTLYPLNMYGYSKHLFDLWLKNQGVLDQVTGLKYFNVFGPNEGHKGRMASAIFHMLPLVKKEKVVRLFQSSEPEKYKDGEQMRDFIYAKDAAKMTCAFLNNHATGIYNIGSGSPDTWNNIAKYVFQALDLPHNIEYIPMPEDLLGKYQNYSAADMTKTHKAIGNAANTTPLNEAVSDYIKNHLLPDQTW